MMESLEQQQQTEGQRDEGRRLEGRTRGRKTNSAAALSGEERQAETAGRDE